MQNARRRSVVRQPGAEGGELALATDKYLSFEAADYLAECLIIVLRSDQRTAVMTANACTLAGNS
jgi:hypothetical protein